MDRQYELQHLDIKPGNLFVVSNHVKVADFGLVNSLKAVGQSLQLGAITPLYAAPELFLGSISRRCDQYSLAIVFQELLTASLPFSGSNTRQLLVQHTKEEPDLRPLPTSDRPAVARALAKEPGERFDSCTDFVAALEASSAALTVPFYGKRKATPSAKETESLRQLKTVSFVQPASVGLTSAGPIDEIAGHEFHDCLGSSPLMDVWRGQGPDGRKCLLKFLYGFSGRGSDRDQESLDRLRALQHASLLPFQILQVDKGRLVVASDYLEATLRDRLQHCLALGLPGIPRDELLGYLGAVAEVLDSLQQRFEVQHLMLNPRNLMLDQGNVRVADFGLAQLLWLPAGQAVAERNARYAPPELLEHKVSPRCDQYSLALIYHELLTGTLPPHGSRAKGKPNLDRLPLADRGKIARALERDPDNRFASNVILIQALQASPQIGQAVPAVAAPTLPDPRPAGKGGGGRGSVVLRKFSVSMTPEAARMNLKALCQQVHGNVFRDDGQVFGFHVPKAGVSWKSLLGRPPALEVLFHLAPSGPTSTETTVQIVPIRCAGAEAAALLEEIGPQILHKVRTQMESSAERRGHDRLKWDHPLRVHPILDDGSLGEPVLCRGKDISLTGIGFFLQHPLPTWQVNIELPTPFQAGLISVPATLVRNKRGEDGSYEVGALFRLALGEQALAPAEVSA
jgi:serine/threonine protein kinase